MTVDPPFLGQGWIPPTRGDAAERRAAARMVLRLAGDDETAARRVLAMLGLTEEEA